MKSSRRPDPGLVPLHLGLFTLAFGVTWLADRRRARRLREQRIAKSIERLRIERSEHH